MEGEKVKVLRFLLLGSLFGGVDGGVLAENPQDALS